MSDYTNLNTLAEVDDFLDRHSLALLFISRTDCSVCHSLFPQIQELLEDYPAINMGHVNADHLEAIAGRFSVFTVPVILVFVEGKEYLREARIVQMEQFAGKLNKLYTAYLS